VGSAAIVTTASDIINYEKRIKIASYFVQN
jgi:hypothetical protein